MAPPRITIRNVQRRIRVHLAALRKSMAAIVGAVLQIPNRRTPLLELDEICVVLISDRRMSELHHEYLGESGPTDVITFDHGEIFISVDTARRNAREFGNSLTREIQLYIIHGLLHLHGFDDRGPRPAKRMKAVQESILNSLN